MKMERLRKEEKSMMRLRDTERGRGRMKDNATD